ncbi:unnamed protein product, partial [Darwinula stevensoni]
ALGSSEERIVGRVHEYTSSPALKSTKVTYCFLLPYRNLGRRTCQCVEDIAEIEVIIHLMFQALACLFTYMEKARSIPKSCILLTFWALLFFKGSVSLWSRVRHLLYDVNLFILHDGIGGSFEFFSSMIEFLLISGELILYCFMQTPPTYPRNTSVFQNRSPEGQASLFSRIWFSWCTGLIWLGWKRPLTFEILWDLNVEYTSQGSVASFNRNMMTRNESPPFGRHDRLRKSTTPPVRPICISNFILNNSGDWRMSQGLPFQPDDLIRARRRSSMAGLLLRTRDASRCRPAGDLLFSFLSEIQKSDSVDAHGFSLFSQSLRLSPAARKKSTVGEMVNLMSVDAKRFLDIPFNLSMILALPIQLGIACYLLWAYLGPSVLTGMGVILIAIPFHGVIASRLQKLQVQQMREKDERVKLMNEVLNGIKVLKLYAWELPFQERIMKIRDGEIQLLRKQAYVESIGSFLWSFIPFLVGLVSLVTFVLIDSSHVLDASTAFVSLSLLRIIRIPIAHLPRFTSELVQTMVSVKRINSFMNANELDPSNVSRSRNHTTDEHAVLIENGTLTWSPDEPPVLTDLHLRIPVGKLVAVVGQVGSGKSSLLSAFLGDMEKVSGLVNVMGEVAYVPQEAWIRNASVKDNVIFGKTYKDSFYKAILSACALVQDLTILPASDMTEIGEKGINLSGGQKQRVSLARAVYSDADVYFMDDPLSAVDSHVGKHIFQHVIGPQGLLKNKVKESVFGVIPEKTLKISQTRVLVTHGITHLPQMDLIIVMKEGRITEMGSYQELVHEKGAFSEFIIQFISQEGDDSGQTILPFDGVDELENIKREVENVTGQKIINRQRAKNLSKLSEGANGLHPRQVKWLVYLYFLKSMGLSLSLVTILLHGISEALIINSNIALSKWAEMASLNHTTDTSQRNSYIAAYSALGLSYAGVFALTSFMLSVLICEAGRVLHKNCLRNVLRNSQKFFDTNPVGRILNRFSQDVSVVDEGIAPFLKDSLICAFEVNKKFDPRRGELFTYEMLWESSVSLQVIGAVVIIIYTVPWFLVALVPIVAAYYLAQDMYVSASRQLKRLESVWRSTIYSHFGETVNGISSVRAYRREEEFIRESEERLVESPTRSTWWLHNIRGFPSHCLWERFIEPNLDWLLHHLRLVCRFLITSHKGTNNSRTKTFNWLALMMAEVETNIVAVERIKEYCETPSEAPWEIPERKPKKNWPQEGNISFQDYQTRYREGLELVLKGISLDIKGGEKIGLVGRTGAGKSSLMLGLFRIIEKTGGKITIDGIDISQIGLHDLRSHLTIIPQRQLICLTRALLRKSRILVLDEATASVDLETDELIQNTIRREFKSCTVLTIAHRMNTIMDYDRVLVLDGGEMKEFGSPTELLRDAKSIFAALTRDAGINMLP